MARISRPPANVATKKTRKFSIDIRYLVVANIILNLVTLYFIKFG